MKRATAYVILFFIVLAFSLLALYQLKEQGLLYHDTGDYLLEAKFVDEGLHILATSKQREHRPSGFWEEIKAKTNGVPPYHARPGHIFILWFAGTLAGFGDILPAVVTTVLSILGLCLTFFIGRKVGGLPSAIYSTTILASSTFYLVYSRAGLAEPAMTFFFLVGILLYIHSFGLRSSATMYWVGFCTGYAFCCNQWRAAYIPALPFLWDCILAGQKRWELKYFFRRAICNFLGILTPLFIFQVPYAITTLIAGKLPSNIQSYWSQLVHTLAWRSWVTWFTDPGELTRCFWAIEGPFWTTLVAVGWIFLLWRAILRRRFPDIVILSTSLLPFLSFSITKYQGQCFSRLAASIIPMACVAAGEMLAAVQRYLGSKVGAGKKHETLLTLAVVAGILSFSLPRSAQLGITRSGYAQAKQYLSSTGEKKFMIFGNEKIWRFYLGKEAFDPFSIPMTISELVNLQLAQGVKYGIVDYSTIHSKYTREYIPNLLGHARPVAVIPNLRGNSFPNLIDDFGFEGARIVAKDPFAGFILVYSMQDIARSLDKFEVAANPTKH